MLHRGKKIFLFLLSLGLLNGCSPGGGPSVSPTVPAQSPAAASLPSGNIESTHPVSDILTLVETRDDASFSHFELHNSETGETVILPTLPWEAELESIVSENYFIFRTTGRSSESTGLWFPARLHCFRAGADGDFICLDEPLVFGLSDEVQAGSDKQCRLAAVSFSFDAVSFLFRPLDEEHPEDFYAAFADIPLTSISCGDAAQTLTLFLDGCFPGEDFYCSDQALADNPYLEGWSLARSDSGTEITLTLSENAACYYAEKSVLGDPWLTLRFA